MRPCSRSIAASSTTTPAKNPATTASAPDAYVTKAAAAAAIAIGTTTVGGRSVRPPPEACVASALGAGICATSLASLNEGPPLQAGSVGILDGGKQRVERSPAIEHRKVDEALSRSVGDQHDADWRTQRFERRDRAGRRSQRTPGIEHDHLCALALGGLDHAVDRLRGADDAAPTGEQHGRRVAKASILRREQHAHCIDRWRLNA